MTGSLFDFPAEPTRPTFPITRRQLTPTDVSSYLRLNRCDRFLRLKMYERTNSKGNKFLYEWDVAPQTISPLLTRTGGQWETSVNMALQKRFGDSFYDCGGSKGKRQPDNGRLVQVVQALLPGRTAVIVQPRLAAPVGTWDMRGDADLVRLERRSNGGLHILIADIKSSPAPKVEYRLQAAFYETMLRRVLLDAGIADATLSIGILYRGPASETEGGEEAQARREAHREQARVWLDFDTGFLEITDDTTPYLAEVENFVAAKGSSANRVAEADFSDLFFTIAPGCDDCLYHEFCLQNAHLTDDLSLVPYLSARDKKALHASGITDLRTLATLKKFDRDMKTFTPMPENEALLSQLATTSAGPRLEELILRARANRKIHDRVNLPSLPYLPHRGHTSLPFTSETHNPNLVKIYVDTGFDFVEGRMYLLGARVVAYAGGVPVRTENIVEITDGPPDTGEKEAALFARWIRRLLPAIVWLAEPEADGARRAPLHLIFWNEWGQRTLLDALARNFGAMHRAMPALYDFLTQMAAFDSPIASFLADEVRQLKNYNFLCQSLQRVSSYLGFDWNRYPDGNPTATLRELFYTGLFDVTGKLDLPQDDGSTQTDYYTKRARHSSQIPLEYVYCAWHRPQTDVAEGTEGTGRDPFRAYRNVTIDDLLELQNVRLEAVEHIAGQFKGNDLTLKSSFLLPDLSDFSEKADTLAQALQEFLMIERHTFLSDWRRTREQAPEARVLAGESLLVRYVEDEQDEGIARWNQDNQACAELESRFREEYKAANPNAKQVRLTKQQKEECQWAMEGMALRLRIETDSVDADLDTVLGLANSKDGDHLVFYPRLTVDSRLPREEQKLQLPTPKEMLYGCRVSLKRIVVERNDAGKAIVAWAEVVVNRKSSAAVEGYLFGTRHEPIEVNGRYTLEPDPTDYYGYWQKKVVDSLVGLENAENPGLHPLYNRISRRDLSPVSGWNATADAGQARFWYGLQALHEANLLHGWESSKAEYIGQHGGDPLLLVQGPPGTGKSYSTAFAILARVQGALVAKLPCRVFLSCKTHSATNVLLSGVVGALRDLGALRDQAPDLWDRYFDERLLSVPLWRMEGGSAGAVDGAKMVQKDSTREKGQPKTADEIASEEYLIFGATPGGVYGFVKDRWGGDNLCGHFLCDLLILDEASQMSLPEALMASLPLGPDGRLIVVGDPRQMPPIVQHAWEIEPRRTFQQFQAFESLFSALARLSPPFIRFEESFRLHSAMAKFLRDEVYLRDGINYHSNKKKGLPDLSYADPFVRAVLDPDHPLIVIEHEEDTSQKRNVFEEKLIGPVLSALADPAGQRLDARDGLGVVVPHRAQRVGLRQAYPQLCLLDEETGEILVEAVDTVEKYQGDEREVVLVSATESDPEYIQGSASFLLDPRRLTVALSRAKRKMILVASRSIFQFFSSDEELWERSQLWKNLLRRTCTTLLWEGEMDGKAVRVWGNNQTK